MLHLSMSVLLCCAILAVDMSKADDQDEDCPVWFSYNPSLNYCMCSDGVNGYISCHQQKQRSSLFLGITLGYDNKNETVVAAIPYIYPQSMVDLTKFVIELRNTTIIEKKRLCHNLHRKNHMEKNIFCGSCDVINGTKYGPAIYSYGLQCAPCNSLNVIWYILLQLLPMTLLYAVLFIFKFRLTSPYLFHYIIFCNVVTAIFRFNVHLCLSYMYSSNPLRFLAKIVLTMIGFFTLDFFRFVVPPFCITNKVKDIAIPFVDMIPALYLLILTLIIAILAHLNEYQVRPIVWMWKPFKKCCKKSINPFEALSHTYATFFVIFFIKTLYMTALSLYITDAFTENNTATQKFTVFYDPTVTYFRKKHIVVVMIISIIASFLILPTVFLLIIFHSSLFQKVFQQYVSKKWRNALRTFVHTFQYGLKDGTRGTRDHRSMTGGYMLAIILFLSLSLAMTRRTKYKISLPWPLGCAFFSIFSVTYGALQPYKKASANTAAAAINGTIAVLFSLICYVAKEIEIATYYHSQRMFILSSIMLITATVSVVCNMRIAWTVLHMLLLKQCTICFKTRWKKLCGCIRTDEEERLLVSA